MSVQWKPKTWEEACKRNFRLRLERYFKKSEVFLGFKTVPSSNVQRFPHYSRARAFFSGELRQLASRSGNEPELTDQLESLETRDYKSVTTSLNRAMRV